MHQSRPAATIESVLARSAHLREELHRLADQRLQETANRAEGAAPQCSGEPVGEPPHEV